MATTFYQFPRLLCELRMRIWELTVEPRTVKIKVQYSSDYDGSIFLECLSGPVPAPLHACYEARIHFTEELGGKSRFYSKAFHDLREICFWGDRVTEGFEPHPIDPAVRLELGLPPEPRYVWVNFELDMIDIGRDTVFQCFQQYYRKIQRLKFQHECGDNWAPGGGQGRDGYEDLVNFINLRECHVVCGYGLEAWHDWHESCFPCNIDNILLIDGQTGKTSTPAEMSARMQWADSAKIKAVEYRRQGAHLYLGMPLVPWLPSKWFEGETYDSSPYNPWTDRWIPEI